MPHHSSFPHLIVDLSTATASGFASLLQHGILVPMDRSVGLVPLLLQLPGFTPGYIEQAVQTIFIDGSAADGLDRKLSPGSTLALSAAMPGLAGAIFRRQGVHGSLRSQSERKAEPPDPAGAGFITLKLFNTIAVDRVDDLLRQGIHLNGKALHDFAARRQELFLPPTALALDGREIGLAELLPLVADTPVIVLAVRPQH